MCLTSYKLYLIMQEENGGVKTNDEKKRVKKYGKMEEKKLRRIFIKNRNCEHL